MKTTVERMYVESLEIAMSQVKLPEAMNQINKITGRNYRRINNLILAAKQTEMKYKSNEWISKEQLLEANLSVKKNEWGTQLYSSTLKDDEKTFIDRESGELKHFKIKQYSYYYVYNVEQLETKSQ